MVPSIELSRITLVYPISASSVSDLSSPPTPNMNKSRVSVSPNADDTDGTPEHEGEKLSKKEKKKNESNADLYR